jgi:hypothetical protein
MVEYSYVNPSTASEEIGWMVDPPAVRHQEMRIPPPPPPPARPQTEYSYVNPKALKPTPHTEQRASPPKPQQGFMQVQEPSSTFNFEDLLSALMNAQSSSQPNIFVTPEVQSAINRGAEFKCPHFYSNFFIICAACRKTHACVECHNREENHVFQKSGMSLCVHCS